ncbi:hypothetical protein [Parapedobacter sp.]
MTKLTNSAMPYRLERLGVFIYKVLLWLSLGLVIGLFTAEMQGFISVWLLFVLIPGSIGLAWVFAQVFVGYTDHKARTATSDLASGRTNASAARIDSVDYAGVRLMEKWDLLVIKMTVFSKFTPPFQTTIRQLMTTEQIEQLQEQNVVTFYEDTHNPGYGRVSLTRPAGERLTVETTFRATKIYPERSKSSFLLLIGRNSTILTRLVNMVLIFALFGFGFLSPFMVTGNVDWLRLRVTYFPQRLVFEYKGNFNAEAFRKTYAKAIAYIGDRPVESLLFYKDYTVVRVEDPDNPGYIEHAIIRGNSVEEGILSLTTSEPDRLFTVGSVSFERLRKVLDDVATDHDMEDIFYIGVRRDTRWGTRDGRIPPDYKQHPVDIHVLFRRDSESFHYHGETGVRLPR